MSIYDATDKKARTAKSKTLSQNPPNKYGGVEFVQFELNKEQAAECKARDFSAEEEDAVFMALLEGGYRISVKWDDYSNSFAAFIQQTKEGYENFGLILPGRGSTPRKAIKQAVYKFYDVAHGNLSTWVQKRIRDEIDD